MSQTALATRPLDKAVALLEAPPASAVSPEERRRIEEIKSGVDIVSAPSVLNFGTRSEQQLSQFADQVLEKVMSRDTGPVHDKLSEIKLVAKGLSPDRLKKGGGFLSWLTYNFRRELQKFTDRFNSARGQIDSISVELEDQIIKINEGIIMLDHLFEQNAANFRELSLHIVAGHELLKDYRERVLPEAERQVAEKSSQQTPDAMLASQQLRDLKAAVERLDRKVMNLEKSKTIAFATMPTIRQVQQTGILLVEELKAAIAHAIPAWKTTLLIAIEQMRQRHGLETLREMTDFTNQQLQSMADQLQDNQMMAHQQSVRGIADVDAITATIGKLVETFDRVDKLEQEARQARTSGRAALAEAERALREQQLAGRAAG